MPSPPGSPRSAPRVALAGVLALLVVGPARADGDIEVEQLPPAVREEVSRIVTDPTVRTEVAARVRCTPETYRWLLAHLPFSARALDALGQEGGRYRIEDGPEARFTVDDLAGAKATCERAIDSAAGAPGRLVVIARGSLDVPLLPTVLGTGVVGIRWTPSTDDPSVLECVATVAFRVQSRLLHALTAPLRDALARVLRDKLALLLRSATALAEVVERDPWRVVAAIEADGKPAPPDLQAFRNDLLAR